MKTAILGLDSFDPGVFEAMAGAGDLPNLQRIADAGGYARLEICSPPQTEVSWTSIATGLDPGGHGIFDFVHRDPRSYAPYVSMLPTKKTALGERALPPFTARTLFEEAADLGYPATALWWPAMFPARPQVPVNTLPGLGTPDIRGRLGVGTLCTTEDERKRKTTVARLEARGTGRYAAVLQGPQVRGRSGPRPATASLTLETADDRTAWVTLAGRRALLRLGEWSEILEVRFKAGLFFDVHAVTRVILTSLEGVVRLYVLPMQIHPLHSWSRYASPRSFAGKLWQAVGPYLTLGWPQDTTGLEEGCISDDQFLALCDLIFERRKQIFFHLLDGFEEGVLAGVFDDLDRVQHMFRRDRPEVVRDWYLKLDGFVGEVDRRLLGRPGAHERLVLSDHGFTRFDHKVHLNGWLRENGYLALRGGVPEGDLTDVEWGCTRAYAVGLNSIYLNLAGREGQGVVAAREIEALLGEIQQKLGSWRGPDGELVVRRVRLKHETYHGAYARLGPDLIVGYAPGYRASSETALGKAPRATLEPNGDHWGADHCVDADVVPGVVFANRDLRGFGGLSFRDIPFLAVGRHLDPSHPRPPSQVCGEGQADLEERLKGLGYL